MLNQTNKEKLFKRFESNFNSSELGSIAKYSLNNIYEAFLDSLDNILTDQNKGGEKNDKG